ncbi:MAG: FxsA family protein [Planctomycetaceae bacterium]|nr:FxsA family protein [Planctomycetaceae bacterium]
MAYWKLILLFIFIPVIELAGLWVFFSIFKLFYTILIVFGVSIVGVLLAKRQGMRYWIEFNRQIDNGEVPRLPVMNGMLIFVAAVFLMVPGILSDVCGIVLLLPFVRAIIIDHLTLRFEEYRKKTKYQFNSHNFNDTNNASDDVIDVS